VQTPRTMAQFFGERLRFDLQLIGSLQSDALHLKKILAEHVTEHGDRPASVLMLTGPEGDFTPAELEPGPQPRLPADYGLARLSFASRQRLSVASACSPTNCWRHDSANEM
jgi:hypothetical protein